MKVHFLIVEPDEKLGNQLAKFIDDKFGVIAITKHVTSVSEALTFLAVQDVEVFIVSTQLGEQTVFDLVDYLTEDKLRLILTSGNIDDLVQTNKLLPFAYLLKPIDNKQLGLAVNRAIKDVIIGDQDDSKIKIPLGKSQVNIWKSQIVRCEADSNYTKIILTDEDQKIVLSRTLRFVEENILKSDQFVRTHKSHLVNVRHIISKLVSSNSIQLNNGDIVPVSRSKKELIETHLRSYH